MATKVITLRLVVLGLFLMGVFFLFSVIVKQKNTIEMQEQIIGGDTDEGGCLIGAGYSWCEVKQKCLRVWEEPCEAEPEIEPEVVQTDEELIKAALVTKNNWEADEIAITIAKNDGEYATGGVGATTPQSGGGIWFAAKVDDEWQIVWDGNGVVMCEDLTDYADFPIELIPECYDSTQAVMVER